MLKKPITYTQFDGVEVTDDFYFNLTKAELIELELGKKGGLSKALQDIIDAEDGGAIVRELKNIILMSYGERSEDGKRFIKTDELREEFASSEAYSVLFVEMATDADAASSFVQAIMPKDLTDQLVLPAPQTTPSEQPVARELTEEEITSMSNEELRSAIEAGATLPKRIH